MTSKPAAQLCAHIGGESIVVTVYSDKHVIITADFTEVTTELNSALAGPRDSAEAILGSPREQARRLMLAIASARDHHAHTGGYPWPPNGPDLEADQSFDDWAADLAERAAALLESS